MVSPNVKKMIWRKHPNLIDYEVSEYGNVRRIYAGRTRKAGHQPKGGIHLGYHGYKLMKPDGSKHQVGTATLVLETFIGPKPTPKHEACHNDGNRLNNHKSNLRWDTRKGNHADLKRHGTSVVGARNGRAILTDKQVIALRKRWNILTKNSKLTKNGHKHAPYGGAKKLSAEFGISQTQLATIVHGSQWRHL